MSGVPVAMVDVPPIVVSIEVQECVGVQGEQAILRQRGARVEVGLRDQAIDESDVLAHLAGLRLAAGREPDRAADLGGQVAGCFPAQPIGEAGGLFVGERAVQEAEGLRGHGGGIAHRATEVGIGRVMRRHDRDQERSLDVHVDAAPGRLGRRRGCPALARHRLARP